MRKIARYAVAMILAAALALTGCGGQQTEQAANGAAAPAGKEPAAQDGAQSPAASDPRVQATLKAAADLEALLNGMSDGSELPESDADDF